MKRIERIIKERLAKGNLPIAYDCYNRLDFNDYICCLNCKSLNYGRGGAPLIFERIEDGKDR